LDLLALCCPGLERGYGTKLGVKDAGVPAGTKMEGRDGLPRRKLWKPAMGRWGWAMASRVRERGARREREATTAG
jgi:hypothetical protein